MTTALNVERLLQRLAGDLAERGVNWSYSEGTRRFVGLCPSPDHNDHDPSWSIVDDPGSERHGSHHCFSCGYGGGSWELAAAVWGVGLLEAGRRLGRETGWTPPPVAATREVDSIHRRREVLVPAGVVVPTRVREWPALYRDYLQSRGVGHDQARRWGIGYAAQGPLSGRVWVPIRGYRGELVAWSTRDVTGNAARRYLESPSHVCAACGSPRFSESLKRGESCGCGVSRLVATHKTDGLLGLHRAVPIDDRVTVCEGTWSCLALERANWPNPLGILGSDVMGGRGTRTRIHQLGWYGGPVYVATDPDQAGDKVFDQLKVLDGYQGLSRDVVRVRFSQSPDDCDFDELRSTWLGESKSIDSACTVG